MYTVVVENFDVKQIAESGQCFRWHQLEDENSYSVVAFGKYLEIRQSKIDDKTSLSLTCTEEEFNSLWKHYLDLDTDYNEIASCIDITSSCGAEAKSLLASIKQGNDQVYNDEISYRNERMRAQERMATEKMKSQERITTATIRAARDVAKAYYGRQTNYVYIW